MRLTNYIPAQHSEWGRSSWKYFLLKRNEFSLECVIHVSYSIYVYLNFPVISTAKNCFQLVCVTTLACLALALSPFSPFSPFLSVVKMTTVDSLY